MTTFDKREEGFEKKYAVDEELLRSTLAEYAAKNWSSRRAASSYRFASKRAEAAARCSSGETWASKGRADRTRLNKTRIDAILRIVWAPVVLITTLIPHGTSALHSADSPGL